MAVHELSYFHFPILLLIDRLKVNLSSATVAFTKGVLGFLADGLIVNTPQASDMLIIYQQRCVVLSLSCMLYC